MSSTFAFPSPVGGVSLPSDFAPSVVFAVMYGLLMPIFIRRISNSESRAVLSISSIVSTTERIAIFSLRSMQSHDDAKRMQHGLLAYVQATFGVAFIGSAMDVVVLARCLLVNSTKGPIAPDSPRNYPSASPFSTETPPSSTFQLVDGGVPVDQPRKRRFYRRFTDIWKLIFLTATIPGIIAGLRYPSGITDPATADYIMTLRYVSSGLALLYIIFSAGVVAWIASKIPGTRRSQIIYLFAILACNASTAIYRLAFMYSRTTSLTSTAPGSGNTATEKATFYIFHILSDWGACALLLVPNVRQWFNTGLLGDYRSSDPPRREPRWAERQELAKARKDGTVV
ncbi:hypothetical protein BJ138DRAFT_1012834 [Hygrophoropsis aurantiaca]|uniref:Uncharacterized protein n=1 Tax=Hygrophoropsis aurantiaca TaxID=72124 RepID=A0ACB8A4J9_9AGAM|nr:hypothetical protein BJ138DRAFT_1012834 [Hygrophoropsis aurantiaca]